MTTSEEVMTPVNETEALRQQLLQAQRLTSVGELASSIAHEFNNILTTIINSAKLGGRNPDPAEKQGAFERVVKAGQRAAAIAGGMLGRWMYRQLNASLRLIMPSAYADRRRLTAAVHRQYLEVFPDAGSRERVLFRLAESLLGSSAFHGDAMPLDMLQGFLFSKPLPAADFQAFALASHTYLLSRKIS